MKKKLDLSPFPCTVVYDSSQKHFEEDESRIGLTLENGSQNIVWLNKKNDAKTMIEAAVHESVHVVQNVQRFVEV